VNRVSDEGLRHLSKLQRLKLLDISNNQVSDKGLEHLSELKELATLDLRANGVTDEGMKTLQKLENLRKLSVAYTKVTDAGLKQLKGLKKLQRLDLRETRVTAAGQREIKEALPKLEIGEIPQLPDWYKIYADQQWHRQFPIPPFAFPPIVDHPHFHEQSSKSIWSDLPGWVCPALCVGGAAAASRRRSP
jgi:hypothetical protein